MNLLKKYCVILVLCCIASCSDENDDINPTFDSNSTFTIENVTTSTIKLKYSGTTLNALQYGIRKVGTQEFKAYDTFQDITDLEPAQEYEITLMVSDTKELPFEIIKFITPPFDYITTEEDSSILRRTSYSEQNFKHELTPNITSDLSQTKFFWISTTDITRQFQLSYSVTNGKIVFTAPKGSILSTPYQEYHIYYLAYQINNSEIQPFKQNFSGLLEDAFFVVFNTTPQITETVYIKNSLCQGNKIYELSFQGYFFNNQKHPSSTAIITRLDDGLEIILTEDIDGISENCREFDRYLTLNSFDDSPAGLERLHYNTLVGIKLQETLTGNSKFTTGDYKIKLTFSNGKDDFFETNEYPFTLE